ncbi:DUF4034 domain-containing protein [Oryzomicrobium sp.]|uniref:DUF4034 domain-containing protein n=1 Tax=Oryzomicrobium sp. TaxID=1911578 RepID=UPI002FDF3FD5
MLFTSWANAEKNPKQTIDPNDSQIDQNIISEVQRHPQEILALLHDQKFNELDTWLNTIQSLYEQGRLNEQSLWKTQRVFAMDNDQDSEIIFNSWIEKFPKSYAAHVARGFYYEGNGWRSRGSQYISETPAHRLVQMNIFFRKARTSFEEAKKLTAKPIAALTGLLTISATEGEKTQRDNILDEILKLAPNSLTPRKEYLGFIQPKWGGSYVEMEVFIYSSKKYLSENQANVLAGELQISRSAEIENQADKNPGKRQLYLSTALSLLDQTLALTPSNVNLIARKAGILSKQGENIEALRLYDQAIDLSHGPSLYASRAALQVDMHNHSAAVDDFSMAANLGNLWAQQQLGWINYTGAYGVQKNPATALKWFYRSAIWGDTYAQLMTGNLIREGANGHPNFTEAIRWYRLAAEDGYAPAQTNLGSMYWNGMGVETSRFEAMYWWRRAAAQNDAEAKRNIQHLLNPLDKAWMLFAESIIDPLRTLTKELQTLIKVIESNPLPMQS